MPAFELSPIVAGVTVAAAAIGVAAAEAVVVVVGATTGVDGTVVAGDAVSVAPFLRVFDLVEGVVAEATGVEVADADDPLLVLRAIPVDAVAVEVSTIGTEMGTNGVDAIAALLVFLAFFPLDDA